MYFPVLTIYLYINLTFLSGLYRARDTLIAQLQGLNKSKPRNKVDENLIGEITCSESAITITGDDLVSNCHHSGMRLCLPVTCDM